MTESLSATTKVLDGYTVYVAPIPKGAKIPPLSDIKLIVEFAGITSIMFSALCPQSSFFSHSIISSPYNIQEVNLQQQLLKPQRVKTTYLS